MRWPHPAQRTADVEMVEYPEVLSAVRALHEVGGRPAMLAKLSQCLDWPAVKLRSTSEDPIDRARGLLSLLLEAGAGIGSVENKVANGTRSLFGLTTDTRGLQTKDRRRVAAADMKIAIRTLQSDGREGALIEDFAEELYNIMKSE